MKKIFLSILALATLFAVSCNKELSKEDLALVLSKGTIYKIKASVDDQTKTAYADGKTFSWVSGDQIAVEVSNPEGNLDFATFSTSDNAATAEFSGEVPDYYRPFEGGYAIYPASLNPAFTEDGIIVNLPLELDARGLEDPLSILPLAAKADSEGNYSFQHATGILKFNFTSIPEGVEMLSLRANNQAIAGSYYIDLSGANDKTMVAGQWEDAYIVMYVYFDRPASGEATIYVPVPVGSLNAGLAINLCDANGAVLYSKTTTKAIQVARKQIVELPTLDADVWQTLGVGKYIDNFFGAPAVNVEIQQNQEDTWRYRIVNPYGAIIDATGYVSPGPVSGPDAYLNFEIHNNGDTYQSFNITADGIVGFDSHYTGLWDDDYNTEIYLAPCYTFGWDYRNMASISHSRVLRYDTGGNPANIQLAPAYYYESVGAYTSDLLVDNNVQIALPGNELLDLAVELVSVSVADESTSAAPVLDVVVALGSDVVGKVGVGSSNDDALAAAASSAAVSSGTLKINLPANAPTGRYYVALVSTFDGGEWISDVETVSYVNPEEEQLTIDDVLGTYNATASALVNGSPTSFTFTIVESDDDNYDVMVSGSFGGFPLSYSNFYGVFDPAVRTITWSDDAVYYDGTYIGCIENYDAPPYTIIMSVDAPGVLSSEDWIVIPAYNTSWQIQGYFRGWKDFSAIRVDDSGTPPLKSPKKGGESVPSISKERPGKTLIQVKK